MSKFTMPDYVFSGKGAVEEALPQIAKCGKKPLIVTGKHVCKLEIFSEIFKKMEKCGLSPVIFDGITGEPTDEMIESGLQVYREQACDFLVGIGGGSPIDSAKAIAAMSELPGKISDYNGKALEGNFPPVVAIPTTSGTGSEVTQYSVITDSVSNIKMLLKGSSILPRIAIVDPDCSMQMPANVTKATGLDAFTHAVEAYTSKHAFLLSDVYAISAIQKILKFLPRAYRDGADQEAREMMAIASLEAGFTINNSTVTLVHGMSRPIGAHFHVPHGISNAMLLSECLKFASEGARDRFGQMARMVGVAAEADNDEEATIKFINATTQLCKVCEVPTLVEYGINQEEFIDNIERMAQDAIASGSPGNTRRVVTEEDCKALYRSIIEMHT